MSHVLAQSGAGGKGGGGSLVRTEAHLRDASYPGTYGMIRGCGFVSRASQLLITNCLSDETSNRGHV